MANKAESQITRVLPTTQKSLASTAKTVLIRANVVTSAGVVEEVEKVVIQN